MNAGKYQDIFNSNSQETLAKLQLSNEWIIHQDTDPKHTAKSTKK